MSRDIGIGVNPRSGCWSGLWAGWSARQSSWRGTGRAGSRRLLSRRRTVRRPSRPRTVEALRGRLFLSRRSSAIDASASRPHPAGRLPAAANGPARVRSWSRSSVVSCLAIGGGGSVREGSSGTRSAPEAGGESGASDEAISYRDTPREAEVHRIAPAAADASPLARAVTWAFEESG